MIARTSIQSLHIIETIPEENSKLNQRPLYTHPEELVDRSDEELCRNAQQGCAASREMLWDRYRDYIQRIVHKENKRQYLPRHEIADALQELYFAFHIAVQRYDPENHCNRKSASFKTFLKVVVARRFSNYCALWRIYHRRIASDVDVNALRNLTVEAENVNSFSPNHADGNGYSLMNWEGILLNELFSDRLVNTMRRLKPKEKRLLEVWLQCGRDKEAAKVLGISPAAAKLRRGRLFHRLKQSVDGK